MFLELVRLHPLIKSKSWFKLSTNSMCHNIIRVSSNPFCHAWPNSSFSRAELAFILQLPGCPQMRVSIALVEHLCFDKWMSKNANGISFLHCVNMQQLSYGYSSEGCLKEPITVKQINQSCPVIGRHSL